MDGVGDVGGGKGGGEGGGDGGGIEGGGFNGGVDGGGVGGCRGALRLHGFCSGPAWVVTKNQLDVVEASVGAVSRW